MMMPGNGGSFRLGTFRNIPIFLHWSLAIIFLFLSWSIASGFSPDSFPDLGPGARWLIGVVTAALFIASVLAHELGHAVVAQRLGVDVRQITLLIFGGIAELSGESDTARAELRIAAAGPVVSLAVAVLFLVLGYLASLANSVPLEAPLLYLGLANLLLGLFNLIPGFPLDGGRILRAIVWQRSGDRERADQAAAGSGQVVGFVFFAVGVFLVLRGEFLSGLWLLAIGWFIQNAATASSTQSGINALLRGVTVEQAMDAHVQMVPGRRTIGQIVQDRVLGQGERFFVVSDEGHTSGILSLSDIIRVPRDRWDWATATQTMVPWSRAVTVGPGMPLLDAMHEMAERQVAQVPVVDGDQPIGVLSREMVLTNIRLRSQLRVGTQLADLQRQRRIAGE